MSEYQHAPFPFTSHTCLSPHCLQNIHTCKGNTSHLKRADTPSTCKAHKTNYTPPSTPTCEHTWTHIDTRTHAQSHSQANFYWTRIQLLNPASGSVHSLLLHLDKSALISADSLCPPCTRTHLSHTRGHTADPRKSLIKWKLWCPFLHPRVNEYQWETDITVLGMCVYVNDKEREGELSYDPTEYVTRWDFFFFPLLFFFFFYLSCSYVSMTSGSLLFPVHRSLIKPSNEEVMHNFICSSATWGHFLTSLKSMIVSFWKAITLLQ